jgi:hypothetical protein
MPKTLKTSAGLHERLSRPGKVFKVFKVFHGGRKSLKSSAWSQAEDFRAGKAFHGGLKIKFLKAASIAGEVFRRWLHGKTSKTSASERLGGDKRLPCSWLHAEDFKDFRPP